jgi:hypothetical protein
MSPLTLKLCDEMNCKDNYHGVCNFNGTCGMKFLR